MGILNVSIEDIFDRRYTLYQ